MRASDVHILHLDGRDVRSDREGLPTWNYERAAKNEWTVTTWKDERFRPHYSGCKVEVLDGNGEPVHGATTLGTVRDSYEDD